MELRLCLFCNCSWFWPKTWRTLAICFVALTALSANSVGMQSGIAVGINGSGAGAVNSYELTGYCFFPPCSDNINVHCITGSDSGCIGSFESGGEVTFYATPDSKSIFDGWGGNCTGQSGSTCQLVSHGV